MTQPTSTLSWRCVVSSVTLVINELSADSLFVFNPLTSQATMQPYPRHSVMALSGAKRTVSLHPASTRGAFYLYTCAYFSIATTLH